MTTTRIEAAVCREAEAVRDELFSPLKGAQGFGRRLSAWVIVASDFLLDALDRDAQRMTLASFDDRTLSDMGISRAEAETIKLKPVPGTNTNI